MRRLPPLFSALPALAATARLCSATAAAMELSRTHSAVSKLIAHLADNLGGALFEKAGNGLKLKPRGERLRKVTAAVLDDLDAAVQALRAELDDRYVDLVTNATYATRWLNERLPRFYMDHPDIEIHLRMSGPQRMPDHETDVVLIYDRLRSNAVEMENRAIGDTSYVLVCAAGYPLR